MTGASACGRCGSQLEIEDLRCAICGLAAPLRARDEHAAAQALVVRCDRCGAAVAYSVQDQAPRCGFCGALGHVERPVDPIEQAAFFIPFAVDPAQAQTALRTWLASLGFFRPPDLSTEATVQSLQPLWWVGWMCTTRALVSWAADSDAGSNRAQWAPHAGQQELDFEHLLVTASRGLTERECAELAVHYDLGQARNEPYGPPRALVERFDVPRSEARHRVCDAIRRSAEHELVHGIVPGSRHRNVKSVVLLRELATDRFALPVYVMAYWYGGRMYRALVHGQRPEFVIGTAPVSWFRIAVVVLGVVCGLIAVAALIVVLTG